MKHVHQTCQQLSNCEGCSMIQLLRLKGSMNLLLRLKGSMNQAHLRLKGSMNQAHLNQTTCLELTGLNL